MPNAFFCWGALWTVNGVPQTMDFVTRSLQMTSGMPKRRSKVAKHINK